jgi:hypothetical protein
MATKKSPRKPKAAAAKPKPAAAMPQMEIAKPSSASETSTLPQHRGVMLMMHNMLKAVQDDKIAVLEVLRDTRRPLTADQIRLELQKNGVILDNDSIVLHMLFLTDPMVNLVRIVPGTNPHQYEAV